MDVDPSNPEDSSDVDFVILSKTICGSWHGFWHHMNVTYEVAVGTKPGMDDVINFRSVNSSHNVCISISGLSGFIKYYFVVRASCSGGSTVTSSDGCVLIDENAMRQHLHVYDGKKCPDTEQFLIQSTNKFVLPNTLVPEVIYTIKLNCNASFKVESLDVIWLRNDVFIPSKSKPVFTLTSTLYNESNSCFMTVSDCYEKMDFTNTKTEVTAYWTVSSEATRHITSFRVGLFDVIDNDTVAPEVDIGILMNFTFTGINLFDGHTYRTFIRPCFGDICTKHIQSDGITVESEPSANPITLKMNITSNLADVSLEFATFTCSGSGRAKGYDIAVFDKDAMKPFSSWSVLRFKDNALVKVLFDYTLRFFDSFVYLINNTIYNCTIDFV